MKPYLLNRWYAWTTNSGCYSNIDCCWFWNDEADSDGDEVRLGRFIVTALWDHIRDVGIGECHYADEYKQNSMEAQMCGSRGVTVSTWDSESQDPSSNLGGTWIFFFWPTSTYYLYNQWLYLQNLSISTTFRYALVPDILPYSCRNKGRPPVPAKVRLRLADKIPHRIVEEVSIHKHWVGVLSSCLIGVVRCRLML